jgi:hypothetical protein
MVRASEPPNETPASRILLSYAVHCGQPSPTV